MEAKILGVLRASEEPLTAKDIARKLSCTKKEVNQIIYDLKSKGVEQKAGKQPPQWFLAKGTAAPPTKEENDVEKDSIDFPGARKEGDGGSELNPKGASPQGATPVRLSDQASSNCASSPDSSSGSPSGGPSDAEIKEQITRMLRASSSPLSAPDIFKKLQPQPKSAATVKKFLGEMERKGHVENISPPGQKPLWKMKQVEVDNGQARLDDKELYTLDRSENGDITFKPVRRGDLMENALTPAPNCREKDPSKPHRPMLECVDEVAALPLDVKAEAKETAKEAGSDKKSPPQGQAASRKPRINLAPNFGSSADIDKYEPQVFKLLQSQPSQSFTCDDIRKQLCLATRDIVLTCLRSLVKKNLVLERKPSGVTGSSQFQYKSP